MNKKSGWRVIAGILTGMLLIGAMTGCKSGQTENQTTEVTVDGVEISTAMEQEQGIDLAQLNKEAYDTLSEKEKKEALALYLTELYTAENTQLPQGEEYDEVVISTKSAVESSLKTNPDITMQELLNQAAALNKYQDGFSGVTKVQYEAMNQMDKDILITACLSKMNQKVPTGQAYQKEYEKTKKQIENFFQKYPDQNLNDMICE